MMFKNLLDKFLKDKLPPVLVPNLMEAYAREPVSFVRGEGLRLWDVDGTEYIDATSGGGAALLGHSHPAISETISLQADKLLSIGNRFHSQEQADLAAGFCRVSGMDKVLFSTDSDSAALAAVDILAAFAVRKNIQHPKILSIGAVRKPHDLVDVELVGFDDVNAIGQWGADDHVIAVMVPALHCAAGIEFCHSDYLAAIRDLCDEHNWLLVVDESLTGLGRSGRWFGYQHADVIPDMLFGISAMANGIPLGVCAAKGDLAESLKPGSYQSQFGGNPLACQVSSSLLAVLEKDELVVRAAERGELLKRKLQQTIGTLQGVSDIRGNGMMIVVELESLPNDFATKCLFAHLVVEVYPAGNAIRLMPALLMNEQEAQEIVDRLHKVILDL